MADPMAPQFFDPQGKPLQGEALQEAWSSGHAQVVAGTQVHMVTPEGDLRLVPAEQVTAARAKGYAPAGDKLIAEHQLQREHGTLGEQAKTFAESAADTATVGGYGYAAGKLDRGYAENLLARREANPLTHVGGTIAGLVPSLLAGTGEADIAAEGAQGAEALKGATTVGEAAQDASSLRQGASAVNQVLAAPIKAIGGVGGIVERGVQRGLASLGYTGDSLAARAGAKALATGAAGAVEGGAFGAGQTFSDNSLEGRDLTAEALMSGIGRNALFGGALSAGLASVAELGSAGLKAAIPSSEKLESFAQKQAARSVGASGKDIEKLGGLDGDRFKATMDELLSYEFKGGEKEGQRLFSSAQNVTDIHDGLIQAKAETGAMKGGIVREIDDAINSNPEVAAVAQPDMDSFFSRVDEQVLSKLRESDSMGQRRLAAKIEREMAPLRADYEATKTQAANANVGEGYEPPRPITFARLDQFEQDLGKQIYGEPVKGGGIQVAPKGAKQLERVRGILSDFQDENAERALSAMGQDPTQLSTLNRQYSTLSSLEKIAGRESGKAAKNRIASPTDHALGLTAFLGSLLSGNVGALGAMAAGGAASIANNLARTRGNSILADIAYRTSKVDNLLENTARALSVSPERLAQPIEGATEVFHHKAREQLAESKYEPLGIKSLGKDFDATSARVRDMAEPAVVAQQISHATGDLSYHYPEQATAFASKLVSMYQHLGDTMPQASGGSQYSPLANQPRVPPREQQRFLTRVNAALHPEQVLRDIGKGKIDKDAVDTLKVTYPVMYGVLRQKVMTNLANNKAQLPYTRTVHLGMVFDFDSDSSLGPRLAGIQQAIQDISAPGPATPAGAPGPTKRGRPGVSKLGNSFALPGAATPGAT